MIRLEIKKLQTDINREAAKISTLTSGKTNKYQYRTGEEILSSDQRQIIEQAKFPYFPLGFFSFPLALERQRKAIEDQGRN